MSLAALKWAREQKTGSAGRKLVLLVLAEFADETGLAYPNQDTIADVSEQGTRTVRGHLEGLESSGLIERAKRYRDDGGRLSDAYRLHIPAKSAGSPPNDGLPAKSAGSDPGDLPADSAGSEANTIPAKSAGSLSEPAKSATGEFCRQSVKMPPQKENPLTGGKRKKLPQAWKPNDQHRDLARSRGVNLEEEAARFRDHAEATGRIMKDWDAAFRMWIRKANDFQKTGQAHPDSQSAKVKAAGPAAERPKSPAPRQGAPEANGNGPTPEQRQKAMQWGAEHKPEARQIWQEGIAQMGHFFEELQKRNPAKAEDVAASRFTKLLIQKGVI